MKSLFLVLILLMVGMGFSQPMAADPEKIAAGAKVYVPQKPTLATRPFQESIPCDINVLIRASSFGIGQDTLVSLGAQETDTLTVQLNNKKRTQSFKVDWKASGVTVIPLNPLDTMTLASQSRKTIRFLVTGESLTSSCENLSRKVDFSVYPTQNPNKVCGTGRIAFDCVEGALPFKTDTHLMVPASQDTLTSRVNTED